MNRLHTDNLVAEFCWLEHSLAHCDDWDYTYSGKLMIFTFYEDKGIYKSPKVVDSGTFHRFSFTNAILQDIVCTDSSS